MEDFFSGCLGGAGVGTLGGPWWAALGCLGGGGISAVLGLFQTAEADESNKIAEKQMEQELQISNKQMEHEEKLAEKQMEHEKKIAKEQQRHEVVMTLAGTRTTGDTTTTGSNEGGSHSESQNWCDTYTTTSGINHSLVKFWWIFWCIYCWTCRNLNKGRICIGC